MHTLVSPGQAWVGGWVGGWGVGGGGLTGCNARSRNLCDRIAGVTNPNPPPHIPPPWQDVPERLRSRIDVRCRKLGVVLDEHTMEYDTTGFPMDDNNYHEAAWIEPQLNINCACAHRGARRRPPVPAPGFGWLRRGGGRGVSARGEGGGPVFELELAWF